MSQPLTIRNPLVGKIAEVEILVDGKRLCVAAAWDWPNDRRRAGLFRIYSKREGLVVGPHYASIPLASAGMKKARSLGDHVWSHELAWYGENKWVGEWILINLGHPRDLVGGEWVDEKGKPIPKEDPS